MNRTKTILKKIAWGIIFTGFLIMLLIVTSPRAEGLIIGGN